MSRAIVLALIVLAPSIASAQRVLHRRPYNENYRLNYGFDHNGGAAGCSDYECGGACYNTHTGSDLGTPFGTTVVAGASGTVVQTNDGCADYGSYGNTCGGRCGNYVRLQHADGSRSLFCHMKRGSLRVSTGQSVTCGQVLGQSASSGSSTGPHLHFGWYASAGSAADDPYRGSCGGPISLWVEQRGYREAVGTTCQCAAGTETCNGRDDDCDGAADEGEVCEIDLLHRSPGVYAPPAFTDVDGDGRADLCARGAAGVRCWLSDGAGWPTELPAIPWSDASGWDDITNYATIRMGDVNGDGLADVCGRANAGVVCATSTGAGFTDTAMWQDSLSDASGWNAPRFYTTIRLADVNGDGRDDLCARSSAGFGCWLSDGAAFTTCVEGPAWSDASGWDHARNYGTIRMADIDGDGRADVCARANVGMRCHLSSGDAFGDAIEGPALGNDAGWDGRGQWSTIRLADVDADGRADLCGRDANELFCALADGAGGFGERVSVAALSDASGWNDESNYATLRVGDIDGDGGDDLCLRANAGIRCWSWDGAAFVGSSGPEWSDENGWTAAPHYETIRIADADGDGLADVCARAGAGWRCHPSLGDSFGDAFVLDELTNDGGWSGLQYYSTIQSASRTCRALPETCNARDDDCDGEVDEHATEEQCNEVDDDCDGEVDEGDVCAELPGPTDAGMTPPIPRADGAVPMPGTDAGVGGGGDPLAGGCACRATATPSGLPWPLVPLVGLALAWRVRRRR